MNKAVANEPLNLRTIQRDYIAKALNEQQGHKYLVLDEFTMDCLTVAFFRSELYEFGIFDTMLLKNVEHLTTQGGTVGVLIVRPTEENISLINAMLSNPPFSKTFLCTFCSSKTSLMKSRTRSSSRSLKPTSAALSSVLKRSSLTTMSLTLKFLT
jgi:hypothetical protein